MLTIENSIPEGVGPTTRRHAASVDHEIGGSEQPPRTAEADRDVPKSLTDLVPDGLAPKALSAHRKAEETDAVLEKCVKTALVDHFKADGGLDVELRFERISYGARGGVSVHFVVETVQGVKPTAKSSLSLLAILPTGVIAKKELTAVADVYEVTLNCSLAGRQPNPESVQAEAREDVVDSFEGKMGEHQLD